MKILAENKFGHGAKRKTKISHWITRKLRPRLGRASQPFDWSKTVDAELKLGTIPKKDQGQTDSCGGQAGSYLLGIVLAILASAPYIEMSARSIYSLIFYPDGGTTAGDLQNLINKSGATTEVEVPSHPLTETFLRDTSWRNAKTIADALKNSGWIKVSVDINKEAIAEAIRDYGALIMQIDGQNNGTWLSATPKPPTNNTGLWGHFMCLCGAGTFDNFTNKIKAFQSWGDDVGDKGVQYFDEAYIDSGYIVDVFALIRPTIFKFNNDLSYGMSSSEVTQLQIRLGMPKILQTGYFGRLTQAYVVAFQVMNSIRPVSGFVGPITRSILNR